MSKQYHLNSKCSSCSRAYDTSASACQRTVESCNFVPIRRVVNDADYTPAKLQNPTERTLDFFGAVEKYVGSHFGGLERDESS